MPKNLKAASMLAERFVAANNQKGLREKLRKYESFGLVLETSALTFKWCMNYSVVKKSRSYGSESFLILILEKKYCL